MTARLTEVVVDARDPEALAAFWCAVLDYVVIDSDPGRVVEIAPARVATPELLSRVRSGPVVPSVVFVANPDRKTVKNRVHLDVSPTDASLADEVARIEALGAVRVDVGQGEGRSWVVLADPEGNEFCVLRSLAEGEFDG
ncbi:VOC family protein [Nocardioides sp. SYSU D00038]|uniref:VOC family protein n=1 Tax=Nocardioides sp. SYSU D00038 TaxID=2812554 RepID=UPI0019684546|nr:VOC family protein [Nocardioides sp. SYSU D00038]